MNVRIEEVKTRRQLSAFIHFPYKLYKGNDFWVPALIGDEYDTFNPKKNAAYEFCDAKLWLAYDEKKHIVGRVAGIINYKSNEIHNSKTVRFGWLDFIDDSKVLKALITTVEYWGKSLGMNTIIGPFGFTDMDKEGLLVKGFDKIAPFTTLYNYDYYEPRLNELGFKVGAEWDQKLIEVPDSVERLTRMADIVTEKYGLHIIKAKNTKALVKKYGMPLFHMYNETFAPLYEFTPLTDRQIKAYLNSYAPILDVDFVCVVADKDEKIVGFAFCVPSLAKAVKRSGGHLFPFGLFRILHALRKNDTLEALMIGILPEYQNKGAFVPMFQYLLENLKKRHITKLITNPQLSDNIEVQNMFHKYEHTNYMVRRSYTKAIL
ncbi:MAG: GNAT family N-acetyltransferase [Candidatus Cryptobacteroides sp.]